MAYVRSLREIPLTDEPHASVIAALMPDPDESPFPGVDFSAASAHQLRHLNACPACVEYLGGIPGSFEENTPEVAGTTPRAITDMRRNLTTLHNQYRAQYGVKRALVQHSTLNNLAQGYANQVADKEWFRADAYHTRPNGQCFALWWNLKAPASWAGCQSCAGPCRKRIGENLARYQRTNAEVVRDWMNSTGHRANILNGNFVYVGFGVSDSRKGNRYWVAHFLGA